MQFACSWLNHIIHTNIMIFITLELFATFRQYPSRRVCVTSLTTFMLGYLGWLHVVKHYSGAWVYPVLEVLNLPMRIVFFIFCLAICLGLYMVGEKLNNWRWRKDLVRLKARGSKSN